MLNIREITPDELTTAAQSLGVTVDALSRFNAYATKTGEVIIPAFDPGDTTHIVNYIDVTTDQLCDHRYGLIGIKREEPLEYVIFAQTWRDALALESFGFPAIASIDATIRPYEFFKSVKVYVIFNVGSEADAQFAAKSLTGNTVFARYRTVPDGTLSDMLRNLTMEQFIEFLSKSQAIKPDSSDFIILDNDHPDTIAEAFESWSRNICGVEHRYNAVDGWSIYHNNRYQPVEDDAEIEKYIRDFISTKIKIKTRKKNEFGGYDTINITPDRTLKARGNINNVMTWLRDMASVHLLPSQKAPYSHNRKYATESLIALNNCIIDIRNNPPVKLDLSPEFYTFNYLPFNYDSTAQCPQWLKFLSSIFTTKTLGEGTEYNPETEDFDAKYIETPDQLAINILQEYFGYFITPQTHLQKIFCIIGEPRSGKGTIARLLTRIMGIQNIATPTLSSLAGEFGLQGLLNKTLAIIGDAHLGSKNNNAASAVEILKGISGEDTQQVNRKNKTQIMVRMPVRFLLLANKIQDLRDSSGALASRFNFLITTNSFLGREDTTLEKRLITELPGIFNWALQGHYRLCERGHLLEHPAGLEARTNFDELSSPIRSFVRECCEVKISEFVPVEIIWKAHTNWSKDNGLIPYSRQKFVVEIQSGCAGLSKKRTRVSDEKFDEYGWNKVGTKVGTDTDNSTLEYCLFGINLNSESKNTWQNSEKFGTDGTRLEQNKSWWNK